MLAAAAPQLSVDRLRSSSGTVDRRSRSLLAAADTGVTREPRSRHSSKGTFAEPTVVKIYGSGTGASAIAFTSTLRRNTFVPGLIMNSQRESGHVTLVKLAISGLPRTDR